MQVKPMHVCKLGPNGKPDDACDIKVHGAKVMNGLLFVLFYCYCCLSFWQHVRTHWHHSKSQTTAVWDYVIKMLVDCPLLLFIYFEDVIALGYCSQTMAMADVCSSVRQRIIEDQEVKLSVFASRPSVRQQYWLACVWSECFYTGLLSFAVLSISNRGSLAIIAMPEVSLFKEELQPLFTGLLIFV